MRERTTTVEFSNGVWKFTIDGREVSMDEYVRLSADRVRFWAAEKSEPYIGFANTIPERPAYTPRAYAAAHNLCTLASLSPVDQHAVRIVSDLGTARLVRNQAAKRCHPDVGGSTTRMQLVNRSFEVLQEEIEK